MKIITLVFINLYFFISITSGQEIKLDAGLDLNITCFDEIQLNARLINWKSKSDWEIGLHSIEFVNDSTAYAAGGMWNESIVLKTINKGKSWFKLDCPASTFINKIFFLNKDTGFIAGGNSNGFILKTKNGGLSWETQYTGYFQLRSIDFINDTIGFSVGFGPILKTIDGGETWSQLSSPTFSYYDVYFLDSLNGLAVGRTDEAGDYHGRMARTKDGGKTWEEKALNFAYSLNKIAFFNKKGYIVASEGLVLSSENYFETWSINNTGVLSDLYDIKFLDQNTGLIVGRNGTILSTIDGGNSWSKEITDYKGDLYSISILNDSTRFIVGSMPYLLDKGSIIQYKKLPSRLYFKWLPSDYLSNPDISAPYVYPPKSIQYIISVTDSLNFNIKDTLKIFVGKPSIYAGKDITILPSEKVQLHALAEVGNWQLVSKESRAWFEDVNFISKDTGFIAGSQIGGVLMKTTDGGKTWIKKITNTKFGLYELSFPTKLCGYVVGARGYIYKTINGGETWDSLFTNTSEHLKTIYFVNQNIGFAGGANGTIIKTIDGGSTWEKQIISPALQIDKIYFINENRGFATASFNWECAFFETFDGGNSWIKRKIPDCYFNITDIQFFNEKTGIMIGGTLSPLGVLKTTDGGLTWKNFVFSRDIMVDYSSVFFVDEFTGYVCTSYGEIIKTVDGGLTWFIWLKLADHSLNSIFFRDENNAFAVGDAGTIAKYHAPSDIHFNWSPNVDITNNESSYPYIFPNVTSVYNVKAYNDIGCQTIDNINVIVVPKDPIPIDTIQNDTIPNDPIPNSLRSKEEIASNIVIFPNPSNGIINIEFQNVISDISIVKIYNLLGEICHQEEISTALKVKYLIKRKFDPGIYFVEIKNSKGKTIKKFVVQ